MGALLAWALPLVTGVRPAAAAVGDCVPPTVSYDAGSVRRGDTIRVIGTAWGDDCLDTPREEPDPGPLGRPLEDIEVFIAQGSNEVLVARGAADDRYQFEVEVPIPSELEPGPVTIVARSNGAVSVDNSPGTLTISTGAPVSTSWAVVEFEPPFGDGTSTTTTTMTTMTSTTTITATTPPPPSSTSETAATSTPPSTSAPGGSSGNVTPWIVAVAVAAAAGFALWWIRFRRGLGDDSIR